MGGGPFFDLIHKGKKYTYSEQYLCYVTIFDNILWGWRDGQHFLIEKLLQ
jgi:hypothetical protein